MNNLLIYYLFGKSIIATEQLPALWGWHFINGTSIKLAFHLVNVMLLFQDLDIIIMCQCIGRNVLFKYQRFKCAFPSLAICIQSLLAEVILRTTEE